jgi:hypothetical protein
MSTGSAENSAFSNTHLYTLTCMLTHLFRLGGNSPRYVARRCRRPRGRSQIAEYSLTRHRARALIRRPEQAVLHALDDGHQAPAGSPRTNAGSCTRATEQRGVDAAFAAMAEYLARRGGVGGAALAVAYDGHQGDQGP